MKRKSACVFFLVFFLISVSFSAFPEGSKQLNTGCTGTQSTTLYLCNNFTTQCYTTNGYRRQFATYNGDLNTNSCGTLERLYFVVEANEDIYFGFKGSSSGMNTHIVYRIQSEDIAGVTTIVRPEQSLPTTGEGFIPSLQTACEGPTELLVAPATGGYDAILWTPPAPGLYYIEFSQKNNSNAFVYDLFTIDLFDITIYNNSSSVIKPGRLYCKSWQFSESNDFTGINYILSDDGIVTSAEFNGMNGGAWVQYANQTGCGSSNWITSRKSLFNQQAFFPQYKIFLNPPDPNHFSIATSPGTIVDPQPYGNRFCDGHIDFIVNVDKPGDVDIELSFTPATYTTVTIHSAVVAGQNSIYWDGKDGSGVPVPNDVQILFKVSYYNGLTNLPLYDVESNTSGFQVHLYAPTGAEPYIFWDDVNIWTATCPPPAPTGCAQAGKGNNSLDVQSNVSTGGCLSPFTFPACHKWPSSGNGWGNLNTINSWWYSVSTSTTRPPINQWRSPQTLIFNQTPPQHYCAGTSGVIFSVTADPNTTVYHWNFTGPGAVITQVNPSDNFITVNFPTATTGNLTVFGTNTNCVDPSATVSLPVTINPVPDVNTVSNQALCHQSSTIPVNFTGTVAGTDYSWINSNTSIGLGNSGSGDIASFTATNSTSTPVTAMITVTPSYTNAGLTCSGAATSFLITVNPKPTVNNVSNQVVCHGAQTTAINFTGFVPGTIFSWTNDNTTIGLPSSGTGDIGSFTATNTTTAAVTANITVTPVYTNAGVTCNGASITVKITVNPIPTVGAVNNQVLCHNTSASAVLFSGNVPGTVFTWANDNTTIGLAVSGIGDISSFTVTNTTSAPVTATIAVTPSFTNSGTTCAGTSTSFTIIVNPIPTVNPLSGQVLCSNTATSAVTFTGFVPGTVYDWTNDNTAIGLAASGTGNIGSFTATNATNAPVTANITATPRFTNAGVTCTGTPTVFTITVNPIPTVNSVSSQTLCNAAPTAQITFTGNVPGTVYTWLNSDISIGLAATGSGDIASFTATNITSAPVTATITVTPDFTNSGNTCIGNPTSFTITVNPDPSVICAPTQTICSGNNTLATPLSSSVASGVNYTWSAVALPVTLYGFTASGATLTAIPSEAIYNPEITQGSVTYTVTAHYGSCIGSTNTHVVLVNPSPTVTPSPLTQNTCSAIQPTQQINFTANVSPTTYTWAVDMVSGLNPGYLTNGTTDNIPAQTLILSGASQGSIRYIITPSSQIGLSCPGSPNYATILVNPLPSPVVSGPTLTCELGPDVTYSTPNIPGHSYLWTIAGGTITSAANISQITVQWGSYTASPGTLNVTETINATACAVTSPAYQVTLQQRPVPTLTGPLTVCDGSANNVYTTEAAMFQYTWLINGGNITSGGNSTVNVTWTNPGAGNWLEVNYVNALGCPGYPAKRINVQVNPLPNTTITTAAGPDCNLQPHLYQTPPDIACTFTWSATTGTVGSGQGTNLATINWLSTGPAVVSVTGIYAGTTGCTSSSTFPTTVYPSPTPTFTACFDLVTTQNAKPILLKGGLPLNGVYQGSPAISFDAIAGKYWFNPGSALILPGMHPITYYALNSYGCANTSTPVSITVLPSNATFACGNTFSDPRDNKLYGTVLLGSQCWMKENLRYSAPSPYTSTIFSTPQTDNCTFERYCLASDPACTSYGALYQWNELMQYNDDLVTTRQGFCPPGWHVPTAQEWQNMIDASQGNGIAGGALKDMSTVQAFHALLGGIVYLNNLWSFTATDTPNASLYWTSTLAGNKPVVRGLNIFNPSVSLYESSKANAFPVRCVKD